MMAKILKQVSNIFAGEITVYEDRVSLRPSKIQFYNPKSPSKEIPISTIVEVRLKRANLWSDGELQLLLEGESEPHIDNSMVFKIGWQGRFEEVKNLLDALIAENKRVPLPETPPEVFPGRYARGQATPGSTAWLLGGLATLEERLKHELSQQRDVGQPGDNLQPGGASSHSKWKEALKEALIEYNTLEVRLRMNIDDTERYGDTETLRADRSRIIAELNRFALDTLGVSFNDLADG